MRASQQQRGGRRTCVGLTIAALLIACGCTNPAVKEVHRLLDKVREMARANRAGAPVPSGPDGWYDLGRRMGRLPEAVVPVLVRVLTDEGEDELVRHCAALALDWQFDQSYRVIPALAKALETATPKIWCELASCLEDINDLEAWAIKAAVPQVLRGVEHPDKEVRRVAVKTFNRGDEYIGLARAMIRALDDEAPDIRGQAALILGSAKPGSKGRKALVERLADSSPYVRKCAVQALASIGAKDRGLAQQVAKLCRDESPCVRSEAVRAAVWVHPTPAETLPMLVGALDDADEEVRWTAADVLGKLGPLARGAVPKLTRALKDQSRVVRSTAAYALGGMGPAARAAVPELTRVLKDDCRDVRGAAAYALRKMGPAARAAVPALAWALNDRYRDVRKAAAYALGEMGPAARAAAPALTRVLNDRYRDVRKAAAYALGEMGPAARAAVPALTRALEDEWWDVRRGAADALRQMGPAARAAVPALTRALEDDDHEVLCSAAVALAAIDPETAAHRAVPVVAKLLLRRDASSSTRCDCAWTLGTMGPGAKAAIPALRQALKSLDPYLRRGAAQALKRIEGEGDHK